MDNLTSLAGMLAMDTANQVLALDVIDQLLAAHRLDEAGACLGMLSPAIADSPEVNFRRARLAMLAFDFPMAVHLLEGLVHLDAPGIRHDLAFCQLSLGRLDDAEATLLPVVSAMAEVPSIGFLNARILHYRARYDQAAMVAQAACEMHPALAEGWGILAMVQLDAGDLAAARSSADAALSRDPRQPDALTAHATLALWAGDQITATRTFDTVLSIQPGSARALAGAGEASMVSGDIGRARSLLEQAIGRSSEHIGTWHALAWCALLENDLQGASGAFNRAMELDRNFGETHGGVALVHVLRGETEEGKAATRRALRLDPASRNGRYAQSLLWQGEGKLKEANAMVDGILADSGVNASGRPADFIELLRSRLTPPGQP